MAVENQSHSRLAAGPHPRYRALIEHANEGISVIQERRIVFANRRKGVATGYPPELLLAMPSAVSLIRPDDPALYTLAFGRDGSVRVKAGCNMGTGSWLSESASQLQFGVLATTQAECGPNSLHDRYKSQFQRVRSYVLKDGHLFLATMADGSITEFEPAPVAP